MFKKWTDFIWSFVRIVEWVGGVRKILTVLGFQKPFKILDHPLMGATLEGEAVFFLNNPEKVAPFSKWCQK